MIGKLRAGFFVLLGHLFLPVGVVGLALPILPGVPFILLAGVCYAKGSRRFHAWFMNHRLFGPIIKEWREHGSIPIKAKAVAVAMIAANIAWSFANVPLVEVRLGLVCVGIAVTFFILTRPSKKTSGGNI